MASNSRESVTPPRELLVTWLARLYRHGLTTTTGGNLSMMDDDGTLYITPSGGDKAIVPPEKIAVRHKAEKTFQGPSPPSMEWPLHTAAYEARRDCKAVLHAHSMTLVAFSIAKAKQPLQHSTSGDNDAAAADPRLPDTRVLLGAYQACGKVSLAPYAMPGSQELAEGCRAAFEKGADCVILQNHGVVVVGSCLRQAYDRFVSLEYLARSIVNAVPLGVPLKPLPMHILKHARDPDNERPDNPFPGAIPHAPRVHQGAPPRVMNGQEKELRSQLCQFVHRAYDQNLVTSSSGSFSARVSADNSCYLSFLITPTGVDRRSLEPSDLCFVSNSSKYWKDIEEPPEKMARLWFHKLWYHTVHTPQSPEEVSPSRASMVHGTIYAKHPDINFIMVVQPPFATSYCITGLPFDSAGIPESHIVLHNVKTLPIEAALQDDGLALANALVPASGQNTVLVQSYGLVSVGKDLLKTFVQVEVCESMCGVTLTGLRRGDIAILSKEQVKDIDKAFHMAH